MKFQNLKDKFAKVIEERDEVEYLVDENDLLDISPQTNKQKMLIRDEHIHVALISNDPKNLVEKSLEHSLRELFKEDIFQMQGLRVTRKVNEADVIMFMVSDHLSAEHVKMLERVDDDVLKIGFITSGTANQHDLSKIENLTIITHKVETKYPNDKLKKLLKAENSNLIRLPLSPMVSRERSPHKVMSYETPYHAYLMHLGFYEMMANSLPDKYTELVINCDNPEQATDLKKRLIYSAGQAQDFQNKVIIKVTTESNDELVALKEHAMIKLLTIMRRALSA